MRIGIIYKHHDDGESHTLALVTIEDINSYYTHEAEIYNKDEEYDMVITIGGDGTVLRAHRVVPVDVPLFCINSGTVGYLTDVSKDKLQEGVHRLLHEKYSVHDCDILQGELDTGEKTQTAINEILMKLNIPTSMIQTKIYIDGEFIDTVLGDAFIVSTALGSTAYSYSAGGSVLHPKCDCMILTVVAPYKPFTPIVVPSSSKITLIPQREYTEKIIICDGNLQKSKIVGVDGTIKIGRSPHKRQFIKVFSNGYFEKIVERRK